MLSSFNGMANGLVTRSNQRDTKSFTDPKAKSSITILHSPNLNRRQMVKQIISVLSVPVILSRASRPVFADVSDGDALPQGAAQFQRVLRAKSDLLVRFTLLGQKVMPVSL